MNSLTAAFLRLDKVSTLAASLAASAALSVAVFAGFWQVWSRFVVESPATWSEALVRLSLVWMVLLGLAVALRQGALVSIDVAHRYAPPRLKVVLETVSLICVLGLLTPLFWYGIEISKRVRFQEMAGLEISISWGYVAIPVGTVFAAIGAIAHYLERRSEEAVLAAQLEVAV